MSPFGAFLDSTLNRLSEAALFVRIIFFCTSVARSLETVVTGVATTLSILTSHTHARVEGLGLQCGISILCSSLGLLHRGPADG